MGKEFFARMNVTGYMWDISTLEWVAFPFSRGSSNPAIELGSLALQTDSLPAELPGDLPDPRIKPGSSALQADSLPAELSEKPSSSNLSLGCV